MKSFSFTKIIQGPLVAVITGVILNLCFSSVDSLKLESDHLVSLPESIEFTYPHFAPSEITSTEIQFGHGHSSTEQTAPEADVAAVDGASDSAADQANDAVAGGISPFRAGFSILICGLTLAVVASLESLLCAEATDKLDPQRRQTDLNQELRAQGIGNFFSGLIGGLPVTQVIVRSSTNIQSGAQSRLAAFVHGVFLIVCVLAIPGVLNLIPLASLAAILFVVGYKLAHPSKFMAMYKVGSTQYVPFAITIAAILMTDLLIGIGIGLVASIFFILKSSYVQSVWVSQSEEAGRKVQTMTLAERVFFINKGNIQAELQKIEPGSKLVIDASNTVYMDQDVVDVFKDFEAHAEFENIEIARVDFVPRVARAG